VLCRRQIPFSRDKHKECSGQLFVRANFADDTTQTQASRSLDPRGSLPAAATDPQWLCALCAQAHPAQVSWHQKEGVLVLLQVYAASFANIGILRTDAQLQNSMLAVFWLVFMLRPGDLCRCASVCSCIVLIHT
jgi:hypothetical protein